MQYLSIGNNHNNKVAHHKDKILKERDQAANT